MIQVIICVLVIFFVLVLPYLYVRFGSTKTTWLKLERHEIRRLKEANRRFMQSRLPNKPSGRPLYKRKMLGTLGVRVFENGIYNHFAIADRAKYRFVPFTEITDIYPVKVESPLVTADSKWLGPKSWKALQIETMGYMVSMIDSRSHDFQVLIPTLKKAMGGRWDSVYRPEEVIWGNYLEGNLLVHKSVRTARPGYVPLRATAATTPGERGAPTTVAEGKGRLLLEESQMDIEKRKISYLKAGSILVAIGIASLAAGILLIMLDIFLAGFFFVFIIILAAAVLFLGGFILTVRNRLTPLRIYENGFEAPLLFPGKSIFISYGEIVRSSKRSSFIDGEVMVYMTAVPNQMVGVRTDMQGFNVVKDHIRSRIGRSEYIVKVEPTPEEEARSRRTEYAMYAGGLISGVIFSVIVTHFIFWGESTILLLWGIAIALPPITMLTIAAFILMMRGMKKFIPRKLNVKIPVAMIVTLLALSMVVMGFGLWESSIVALPGESTELIEPKPISSFIAPGTYVNESFSVDGHILVDSAQTLRIYNSTLVMNQSYDRELRIWVAIGGMLILQNVTIESSSPVCGYTFEIMGSARIVNTSVSDVWGDLDVNDNGGIEIYSNDVIIESSYITRSRANGILVKNSNPLIANNTIHEIQQDGIETRNSAAYILNNTVDDCGWAMIIYHRSEPLIRGNNISDNQHGIWIGASDPAIEDNDFSNNRNYAISYDENSNPTLSGNTYWMNDQDIEYESSGALEVCLVVNIGVGVLSLLVLFLVYKEGLKAEREALERDRF